MITNTMSVRHNWLSAFAVAIVAIFVGTQSVEASVADMNDVMRFNKAGTSASVKKASLKKRASIKKTYKRKKLRKRKAVKKSSKRRTVKRSATKRKSAKRRSKKSAAKRYRKRKIAKKSYKKRTYRKKYARKSSKRKNVSRGRRSLMATLASVKPKGLPLRLAAAVVTVESGWRVNARGSSGERGLMQLMPATARMMGARGNLYNPRINMRAGTKYLNWCYRRARRNVAATIGCYNRGPGKMWAWSKNRITRSYVGKVRRYMGRS